MIISENVWEPIKNQCHVDVNNNPYAKLIFAILTDAVKQIVNQGGYWQEDEKFIHPLNPCFIKYCHWLGLNEEWTAKVLRNNINHYRARKADKKRKLNVYAN